MAKFINETASSLVLVLTDVDSNSYNDHSPQYQVQHRAAGHFRGRPDHIEHEFYCAVRLGKRYQHTNRQGITMELTAIYTRPLHEAGAEHQVINPVDGELTDFTSPCVARSLKSRAGV